MQKIFLLLLQRTDKQLFCTKPQHSSTWQGPKSPYDIRVNYLITNTKIWSLEHSLVMILETTSATFILVIENWQQIKILDIYCNKVEWSKELKYLKKKYIAYLPAKIAVSLMLFHLPVSDYLQLRCMRVVK